MDDGSMTLWVALVILVGFSAFFSASETAFSSLNQIRLKSRAEDGDSSAARVLAMAEQYDKLLSTILIGNNIVNIAAASIGTILFTRMLGAERGATVSTIVLTIIVLIFGEVTPKSLAKESPEAFARFSAPVLRVLMVIMTPLTFLNAQWKKLLNRLFCRGGSEGITEEELITMVSEAESEGGLDQHEGELIRSAITFGDLQVGDILTPRVDIAAVPANLASVLYNNTEGQVQVLAINTLGVLYIVENGDTVQSVEDLKGKTIFASGKGSTPEYALNYMLTQNGIDPETDVTIEWKSEHSECVASLAATENAIAMLPQPFVTTAQTQNENLRVALDITEEWEKLASANGSDATLITGVVVGRKDFVEQNPQLVQEFLSQYEQSVAYTQEDTAGAAALVGQYDIVPEAVAQKALPECNITFIKGEEMQAKLSAYLQTLLDQNPKSIGGQLPGDDFYYLG